MIIKLAWNEDVFICQRNVSRYDDLKSEMASLNIPTSRDYLI